MSLDRRILVEAQYVAGMAAGKPQLTHKRLLAFSKWPDTASEQLQALRDALVAFERVTADKINIAGIVTVGPIYLVD